MDLRELVIEWRADHPGHPLGPGMPPGRTLRLDGESHLQAWERIIRTDPCAYCGRARGGTVDHIVPRAAGIEGIYSWSNLTGACERCNGAKSSRRMLRWLRTLRSVLRDRARREQRMVALRR